MCCSAGGFLQCVSVDLGVCVCEQTIFSPPSSTTILWKSEPQHDDSSTGTFIFEPFIDRQTRILLRTRRIIQVVTIVFISSWQVVLESSSNVCIYLNLVDCDTSEWIILSDFAAHEWFRVSVLMQLCSSDTVGLSIFICHQRCWDAVRHLKQTKTHIIVYPHKL